MAINAREWLACTKATVLQECGYEFKIGTEEEHVIRDAIDNPKEFFDERGIQLIVATYKVDILIVDEHTGEVNCGYDLVSSKVEDPLNCRSLVVYQTSHEHFEPMFHEAGGYRKYMFENDDPIIENIKHRYSTCCGENRAADCHKHLIPFIREHDQIINAAAYRNTHLVLEDLPFERVKVIANEVGVERDLLKVGTDLRDVLEDAIIRKIY
jgi:hypothetical protein